MDKYEYARDMVDRGASNSLIIQSCQENYGEGISTSKLAEWRQTRDDRVKAKKLAAHQAKMDQKREIIRETLLSGGTGYAAQKKVRAVMGEGCGYEVIQQVAAELEGAGEAPEQDVVTPLAIPDEVRADEDDEASEGEQLVHVEPLPSLNGTTSSINKVRQWMHSINAEHLHLSADGKLEVTVRHTFDLGAD